MNADFVKLVEDEYKKIQTGEPFYIGEGNPDADILIIGNECARREDGQDVAVHNVEKWKELLGRGYNEEDIGRELQDYKDRPDNDKYYPLCPWFGQKCIVRTEVVDEKGEVKKIRGEKGTARTWVQYQKLIDWIDDEKGFDRNNFIDFHLDAFHTELSQIPRKQSGKYNEETDDSIKKRMKELFSKPFFQKFPVVIIAAGHYVQDYKINNIEKIFNVTFDKEKSPLTVPNKKGRLQWINMHYDNDSAPRRVLLHTEHFAAAISNDYIRKIAELASPYIERPNKRNYDNE